MSDSHSMRAPLLVGMIGELLLVVAWLSLALPFVVMLIEPAFTGRVVAWTEPIDQLTLPAFIIGAPLMLYGWFALRHTEPAARAHAWIIVGTVGTLALLLDLPKVPSGVSSTLRVVVVLVYLVAYTLLWRRLTASRGLRVFAWTSAGIAAAALLGVWLVETPPFERLVLFTSRLLGVAGTALANALALWRMRRALDVVAANFD